jgi:hypothetical protein
MARLASEDPAGHKRHTREAYDRLAPIWAATTDDGPFNGHLERPALRALIPQPLTGKTVMEVASRRVVGIEHAILGDDQPTGVSSPVVALSLSTTA